MKTRLITRSFAPFTQRSLDLKQSCPLRGLTRPPTRELSSENKLIISSGEEARSSNGSSLAKRREMKQQKRPIFFFIRSQKKYCAILWLFKFLGNLYFWLSFQI